MFFFALADDEGWGARPSRQTITPATQKAGLLPPSVVVKVILEVCLLTRPQIVEACLLCVLAGATFVKPRAPGVTSPGGWMGRCVIGL